MILREETNPGEGDLVLVCRPGELIYKEAQRERSVVSLRLDVPVRPTRR
jgi:hypothetical protein